MSASLCNRTPMVSVFDNCGRTVRDIAYYRHPDRPDENDERITRHRYDARGNLARSADPRLYDEGVANITYRNALGGHILCTQSVDAGTTVALSDAANRPFIEIRNIRITGDGLEERSEAVTCVWQYENAGLPGRLLSMREQINGGIACITDRRVYAGDTDAEKKWNLAGECICHYTPAGLVQTESISLTGGSLSVTRRLLNNADNPEMVADWQGEDSAVWNEKLSEKRFTTLTTTDATGEWLTSTDAKGNQQRVAYDKAGQLSGSWLKLKDGTEWVIVKNITYSAAGQKLREEQGNGVVVTYSYEPETLRLIAVKTERPAGRASGAKVLQDLRYEYDPVGNVLVVHNDAEETRFWRNQKVVPDNVYIYDSLYQLVSASGREMATANPSGRSLPSVMLPIPADSSAFSSYTRTYTYDRAGNMTQIRHIAPMTNNSYTTDITVSNRSNRAVANSLAENPTDVEALFTAGGQQKQLWPGQYLSWTTRNELLKCSSVVRDDGDDDQENYRYEADSHRVLKISLQKTNTSTLMRQVIYLPCLELRTKTNGSSELENLQVITAREAGRAQTRILYWESGAPDDISHVQVRYSYDNLTGSSLLELDGEGNIISMEAFYPYGGTAIWSARSVTEAEYKTVRYSGKERDATGLYNFGYRYYQPWLGRWLSADPSGNLDGLNMFRMVRNNPVTLSDPDGRKPVLGNLFQPLRKLSLSKVDKVETNKPAIDEPVYAPNIKSRRGQIEQQYQQAKAGNKGNWLEAYQRQVRGQLLTSVSMPSPASSSSASPSLSIGDTSNQRPARPLSDVANNAVSEPEIAGDKYIKNIGSEPLSISEMRKHYNQGVISYINISNSEENANEKISQLIREHKSLRKHNEYLFALSESAGLRIMERGRLYSNANEHVFHHNNIYLTRMDILSAGTLFVENNKISITNFSGHYKPSGESLRHIHDFLLRRGVRPQQFEIASYKFNG
ncbi:RHS repeat protein [Kosakonia pseudosacchari]|uniref:RHS repeat domain-containing protein n=1 Tax=Kosakonia pseudosacchari TaxID=1646340 RepID=UPI0022F0C96C|nr:RHS repeat domain-containing protein [Kosakonia pseudosacchari]WBU47298.1 RHS repeat protein [Kosakonia pseudosacchari]